MKYVNAYSILLIPVLTAFAAIGGELKVDINRDSKDNDQYTEIGYVKWSQGMAGSTTASGTTPIMRSFTTASGENATISFAQTTASQAAGGTGITFQYYATAVSGTADLIGDGLTVAPANFAGGGQLQMTITGLEAGEHSLLTFHNAGDGWLAGALGPIDISVNGTLVLDDLPQTIREVDNTQAASSYVRFTVTGPTDVATILFAADPTVGSYTIRNPMINGFEIDTPDIYRSATNPDPAEEDGHVDADSGSVTLSWMAALAGDTAAHNVYFGTDYDAVRNADTNAAVFLGTQSATNRAVTVDDLHATYFWRVDEVSVSNGVTAGTVWSFRPRHLAFPGAEGYGRYARGGRGGTVYEVTSLADYGTGTPVPGTLRYGIEEVTGPRTIVFAVSGLITIESRLTLSDNYVTIAGQTAPGKGICLRKWPLGLSGADDAIVRFIRNRPGNISGVTVDGGGLAGCDHSIMDHCSISWSMDEGFSARGAKNITLQNTMIAEALAIAGHDNYPPGTDHGYAATVGGDISSLHHNLLAHCSGRNWSLGGGLDSEANFAGRLDIRNNVVYNWKSRTTDGGAMEVNFVNNYYKTGAATTLTPYALTMNHEDDFGGSQRCYFTGNVMPGYFNESNQTVGRRSIVDAGIPPLTYETFVNAPFFDNYVTTQSAGAAYKRVLSDVGANRPIDDHDARVIRETLSGTYTYTGTGPYGGYPGLPNSQDDVGGWENYPNLSRPADWDRDGDGLPDWWEAIAGTNPGSTPGDFSDSNADPDADGYTQLDDYLAWMARPHLETAPEVAVEIDLAALTVGFTADPVHRVSSPVGGAVELLADGHTARFMPREGFTGLAQFDYQVVDGAGDSMEGAVGVLVWSDFSPLTLQLEAGSDNIKYLSRGSSGFDYTLQYSTNLSGWTIFANTMANGSWQTNSLPVSISDLPSAFIRAVR